ncbi:MAG TPA: acyl-CoA dehydrogenase family protein [Euzebya sp.]|nr:acyl-CoA dehydrogenase family protein [Euzebya sp.]
MTTAPHDELRSLVSSELPRLVAVADHAQSGRVNRPLVRALGNELLPHLFPRRVGGVQDRAVSATALCVLREELGRLLPEAETALALQGLGAYPILFQGTGDVIDMWLPRIASGSAVAAFALTEPDAGSDAAALSTAAVRQGGGWVLTGEKMWISNAPEADIYTVFARTDPGAGARGVTAFAVPGDSAGLSGQALDLIAPHVVGRLQFDEVFVPDDHVLGAVDRGFRVAMETLDLFRPSVGAFVTGMAQAALDATVAHTARRRAFGGTLRDLQAVEHKVADMAVRIAAARLLVYDAAACYDRGAEGLTQKSAMAKLFATEAAQRVVDDAVQLHGARALEKGHLLERLYREVRAPRIYEGASEVQRSIIARAVYRHAEAATPSSGDPDPPESGAMRPATSSQGPTS